MGEYPASVSAYQEALDTWEDRLDALQSWYNEFLMDDSQTYETVLQETLDRLPELAEQYQDAYDLHDQEITDLKEDLEWVLEHPGHRHSALPNTRRKQEALYSEVKDLDARYGMLKERQKYLSDLADDQFDLPFQDMLDDQVEPSLLEKARRKYQDLTAEEKVVAGFTTLAVAGLLGEEIRSRVRQ